MTPPAHHPSDALLLEYAAGTLVEAVSVVVAAHAELCPQCAAAIAEAEAIGGELLDAVEPVDLQPGSLEAVMARIAIEDGESRDHAHHAPLPDLGFPLPRVLRACVAASGGWRWVAPGVRQMPLLRDDDGGWLRLLRVRPGAWLPRHGHGNLEATLVLQGGFTDQAGSYRPGDMAEVDADVSHRPVVDPGEDCVCLVGFDQPLHFPWPISWGARLLGF